jgi:hypothetical protein
MVWWPSARRIFSRTGSGHEVRRVTKAWAEDGRYRRHGRILMRVKNEFTSTVRTSYYALAQSS